MKINLLKAIVLGLILPTVSNAATYSLQPAFLEAGKTTSFKILEDNKDVSKDYNISYIDSDNSVSEMTITPFAGSFSVVPKVAGSGYQIRAIKKTDSNVIRNFNVSIAASSPAKLAINGGNSQSGSVGQPLSNPLVVQVQDKMGNPISNQTVNWTISSGEGSLSSSSSVSNSNGLASINVIPSKAGSISVSATLSSNSVIKTTFVVTAKVSTLSGNKLFFSEFPSKITNNSNFSVSVVVKNSSGSTVTNASNSITIGLFKNSFCTIPATRTLTGIKSGNASNGQIQFSGLGYNSPETVYIGASSSGLTPVCSKSIVSSCSSGFHSQNGSCVANLRSCNLSNGTGSQLWLNESWSSCSIVSCNSSFHNENGACVSDTRSCNISNGTGSQSYSGDTWGSCQVASCNSSFHNENNSCVSNSSSCEVSNGSGYQTWDGSQFGSCIASTCNNGYKISGESCVLDLVSVEVLFNGGGSGSVTALPSMGSGELNCSSSPCSSNFYSNSTLTISAVPDYGSTFLGFSGDVTSLSSPFDFLANNNKQISVNFGQTFNKSKGLNGLVIVTKLDNQGRLYVGGSISYNNSFKGLIRLNTDGTLDSSFNVGTGFNASVYAINTDSNGNIYVGGSFTSYKGTANNANYIAKLDSNGNLLKINSNDIDSSTGNGFDNTVRAIEFDSSGNIYVGGNFTSHKGTANNANYIAKLDSSGNLAKINSNDTDSTTGNGFDNIVFTLKKDSNGNIYVGGSFTSYKGTANNANKIAKIDSNGNLLKINSNDTDSSTGNGFDNTVRAIEFDSSGNIYLGGNFTSYKGTANNANRIAKLDSSGNLVKINSADTNSTTGNGVNNTVYSITLDSNYFYVVGTFTSYKGTVNNANYIAKLDSSGNLIKINSNDTNSSTGNGFDVNDVETITISQNGDIYVGGNFTTSFIGGVRRFTNKLVKISSNTTDVDSNFKTKFGSNFNGTVGVMLKDNDGNIWVGGSFTSYNGVANNANRIAKLDSNGNLLKINPNDINSSTGNGFNSNVVKMMKDSSGNIWVGGDFITSYIGGSGIINNANRIAKIDSNGNLLKINSNDTNSATGNGFNHNVRAISSDKNGNIYIGGFFTSYMGVANNANYIVKLDSSGNLVKINSNDTNSSTGNGFNSVVRSIIFDSNDNIYIAGDFTRSNIGGSGVANNANYIAKIDSNGNLVKINSNDTNSSTGNGFNAAIYSLKKDSFETIWVGGAFTSYQGIANNANKIAKIDSNGNLVKININDTDSANGNGFDSSVFLITTDSSGNTYLSGYFTTSYIGGLGDSRNANYLAKIDSNGNLIKINSNDTNSIKGNGFNGTVVFSVLNDSNDNVFIGGDFTSSYIGSNTLSDIGNIIKIDSNGNLK